VSCCLSGAWRRPHASIAMAGHLDLGCQKVLQRLLRPEAQPAIEVWLRQAGQNEKRSVLRLARILEPGILASVDKPRAPGSVPRAAEVMTKASSMPGLQRPTWQESRAAMSNAQAAGRHAPFDTGTSAARSALQRLLKPEMHVVIEPWLRQVDGNAKRSIASLSHMAASSLVASMGRPRGLPQDHGRSSDAGHGSRSGLGAVGMNVLLREPPSPLEMAQDQEAREATIARIKKPGGLFINHYDTLDVVRMKVEQRNRGGGLTLG